MEDNILIPMNAAIKVIYIIKEHPEYGVKTSRHNTYEDFGEWICRQFDKIIIINITYN